MGDRTDDRGAKGGIASWADASEQAGEASRESGNIICDGISAVGEYVRARGRNREGDEYIQAQAEIHGRSISRADESSRAKMEREA